jgi:flavin reductase (DIM6/NTAB) family NADH-FMN oxidoreductase RutF
MKTLDLEALSNQERYKLLVGSILPRPIAFVSTISAEGLPNLAPFSFFTAISSSPMRLCFSPMRRGSDGLKKDTLVNIEATQEFVVHIVPETLLPQMNITAENFAPSINEFDAAGLTAIKSTQVKPYRVAESPIQMECVLEQVIDFGEGIGSGSLVIGKVVAYHIEPSLYEAGRINTSALNPVGRLAGDAYSRITDSFTLDRPH